MGTPRVDFGFRRVTPDEQRRQVQAVFTSVAEHYDLMNDVMSLGLHRCWKRRAAHLARLRPGEAVLDVAAGTGDMARLALPRVLPGGSVTLLERNAGMLARARARAIDQGLVRGLHYVRGNAECLPFAAHGFACVFIAFGLRNVADKEAALRSMYAVTQPGGRLLVLEFSRCRLRCLQAPLRLYLLHGLARLGGWLADDAASYRYLGESILRHPDQEQLAAMVRAAGYAEVEYFNLSGGIAAIHRAVKA